MTFPLFCNQWYFCLLFFSKCWSRAQLLKIWGKQGSSHAKEKIVQNCLAMCCQCTAEVLYNTASTVEPSGITMGRSSDQTGGERHYVQRKKGSNQEPQEQPYKISLTPYSWVNFSADQWQVCYLQYCKRLSSTSLTGRLLFQRARHKNSRVTV